MNDKDRIVDEVRKALNGLFDEPDRDWTRGVKSALCEACTNCNDEYQMYAGGVDVDVEGGEWLYDVTCLLYDANGYIKHIPLVAESEWQGVDQINYDFEKLLLARADVRVMVFDGNYWGADDDKFEEFAKYITKCDRTEPGDTYLLAAWPHRESESNEFQFCRIDAFQSHRILE